MSVETPALRRRVVACAWSRGRRRPVEWSLRQRGSAVPMVVACVGVLALLGAACAICAALVVDHRRAQSAADLAALAGARALSQGADPCGAAARLAEANGARVVACTAAATDVRIRVEVAGPRWLGQYADLVAEARAGWT